MRIENRYREDEDYIDGIVDSNDANNLLKLFASQTYILILAIVACYTPLARAGSRSGPTAPTYRLSIKL